MKSRETKQNDLNALTDSLQSSTSAMLVSFTKLTVTKDQEFRSSLREVGANYQVVKNTLARIAVKGTQFEDATEHFKGVTALAWTDGDPVVLSKAISKFMKANADIYTFKAGVVDGRLVDITQLNTIANLPSKEELISKLLWVINSSAQGIVTVINAVPRNLAVVINQIGETKPAVATPAAEIKAEESAPAPAVEEPASTETPMVEVAPDEAAPAVEDSSFEPKSVEVAANAEVAPDGTAEESPLEVATGADAAAIDGGAESAPEAGLVETAAKAEQDAAAPDNSSQEGLDSAPQADAEEKAE